MRIRFRFLSALGFVALALAGCAEPQPLVAKADADAVARYRLSGYDTGTGAAIDHRRFEAPASIERGWSARLTRPEARSTRAGATAVIVYLPALGQADDAPNRWIDAWAKQGYAVLCVQPLYEDAHAWESPAAIDGDFAAVARARYVPEWMPQRIARLRTVLEALRARSRGGEAGLDDLDWSHIALAGSGLGAYTVQRIAASRPLRSFGVRAYLAISPYAVPNGPHAPQVADAPVLMVSSQDDVDPDGMVSDPLARHAAFDDLRSRGTDYYLEFFSAAHRWLEGATDESTIQGDAPEAVSDGGGETSGAQSDDDENSPSARKQRAARERAVRVRSRLLTKTALAEVTFADITTAFFDANLRERIAARAWLEQKAPHWLRDARLKLRGAAR